MGTFASGFFGTLGEKLQGTAKEHRDRENKQKDAQAQIYWDAIKSGNLTPDQLEYSQAQLQKIYGNSKPLKEMFEKFGQITGLYHKHAAAAQQQQPQGKLGEMTPPPTMASPEDDERSQGAGGPGASGTGSPAATATMSAPPRYADIVAAGHPSDAMKTEQDIRAKTRMSQAEFEQRGKEAEQLGLKKGTREYAEFVGTGKFSSKGRLQKAVFTKNGEPMEGSYDPDNGEYLDQKGNVVEDAKPATAGAFTPKEIHYLSPDGKPLFGFRVGMKLYDQAGKELPEGTEFFTRGMLPTETLRQVITYDPRTGQSQINTLETMRTPITGGDKTSPSSPFTRKGEMSPPPSVGGQAKGGRQAKPRMTTPAPGKDVMGQPLGMSSGQQKAQVQRVTAVREATTQVFGDPDNPNFKPLKDFSYLADSPESRERLGTALKYTFEGMEQLEKQHGSLIALIQAYGGVPQALAAAKAGVQRDIIDKLSPEEQDAFDATISSFSSVVGLRSLTSASAAQFSVRALERDIPMIGLTATSSRMFNDKLAHIGEIALNGAKTISDAVMPPAEKDYLKQRLQELRGIPKKEAAPSKVVPIRKGGPTPPPRLNESPDDEIRRLAGSLSKKTGTTGRP